MLAQATILQWMIGDWTVWRYQPETVQRRVAVPDWPQAQQSIVISGKLYRLVRGLPYNGRN